MVYTYMFLPAYVFLIASDVRQKQKNKGLNVSPTSDAENLFGGQDVVMSRCKQSREWCWQLMSQMARGGAPLIEGAATRSLMQILTCSFPPNRDDILCRLVHQNSDIVLEEARG